MRSIDWYKYKNKKEEENVGFGSVTTISFGGGNKSENENCMIFDPDVPWTWYTGIADFPVDSEAVQIIKTTPGVEVYNTISKYRFAIAVCPKFKEEVVLKEIDNAIRLSEPLEKPTNSETPSEVEQESINAFRAYTEDNIENYNEAFSYWFAGYVVNPFSSVFYTLDSDDEKVCEKFIRFVNTEIFNNNIEIIASKLS